MNRLLLTTMLWQAGLVFCAAQGATLFTQVIGSTGHEGVQQGLTYTYTVGEVVISTAYSDNRILTQGFHQPEHTQIVAIDDPDFVGWEISIFPNPATDVLTVQYAADKGTDLRATVVDLAGRIILQDRPLSDPGGSVIQCSSWQPGVYFLILTDPVGKGSATTRIVRL
ncbi:MAG: T9SS type A sorting domain-containing protein [Bacteroidetes bacterium]|nr:MAG: T9SS type A sorting domain-containing protein [Bacteroidota bacterium]